MGLLVKGVWKMAKKSKGQAKLSLLWAALSDSVGSTVESITLSVKLSAKEKQKSNAKKKAKLEKA
jgi:hypothetical protein